MADNPYLVFSLRALNRPAEKACLLHVNLERGVSPSTELNLGLSSRESTPIPTQERTEIQFDLSRPPKCSEYGYSFGSNQKICDMVLGRKKDYISGRHFSIDFNGEGCLVLTDYSKLGTEFIYGGQSSKRHNYPYMLFDDKDIDFYEDRTKYGCLTTSEYKS
jgi:FHA domain